MTTRRSITLALALSASLAAQARAQWIEPCCLLPPALPPAWAPGWGFAPPPPPPVVFIQPRVMVMPPWPEPYRPPPVVPPAPMQTFNNSRTAR